jgi:hypothetical protein
MVGRVVCSSERRPLAARVWLPELKTSTTATVNWMFLCGHGKCNWGVFRTDQQ